MSRRSRWIKRIVVAVIALLVLAGIGASLRPTPIPVETARASRGALVVTVDGAGRTRLPDTQTISSPVAGDLLRILLRPGDTVAAGQVVAEILPGASQPLDARSRAEARAMLGAARAGLAEARQSVEQAAIAAEVAAKEADRARLLAKSQSVTARSLELAEADERARKADLAMARLSVERARREAEVAAAALGGSGPGSQEQKVAVEAPLAGRVFRVHTESAGPVQPGTPLLDIGGVGGIELVVELPTQAAMRITPGAAVRVDGVGNRRTLAGTVRLVEPSAFTKVTALGVEEQRVNVIVDPAGDPDGWSAVGDGFAADAHITVHEADGVLKAPSGAVFRAAGGYAAFTVSAGRAHVVPVEIGERSADEVEIRKGLAEGAIVVVHPSDKLADGTAVVVE